MTHSDGPPDPGLRHRVSILLRDLMLMNGEMEFALRQAMDLNETDFQAMQHLLKHRRLTPGELAHALHLTGAATTTVIDRLVSKGHAERSPHPTDRRRTLIAPSAASIAETMSRLRPMIRAVDTQVRAHDAAGQETIANFLNTVLVNMEARRKDIVSHNARPAPPPTLSSPHGRTAPPTPPGEQRL